MLSEEPEGGKGQGAEAGGEVSEERRRLEGRPLDEEAKQKQTTSNNKLTKQNK